MSNPSSRTLSSGKKRLSLLCTSGKALDSEFLFLLVKVASGYTVMTKHCECHVIAFPASIDQCHWVAVAGTKFIVRYGLGSGGKHEGRLFDHNTPTRQATSAFADHSTLCIFHENQ